MENTGIIRLSTRYLNGPTALGDANPGGAFSLPTGNPNAYIGQLGAVVKFNNVDAALRSDTANDNTLCGGRYQYVQFAADGTAYVAGQLLYWKDAVNYIVTNVAPVATSSAFAGFALGPVTQGNYWVMQTSGLCWVLYKTSPTSTTTSTPVYAVVNTATVDALADATADATGGVAKLLLGTAYEAPASAVTKRALIKFIVEVE